MESAVFMEKNPHYFGSSLVRGKDIIKKVCDNMDKMCVHPDFSQNFCREKKSFFVWWGYLKQLFSFT